MEDKNLNKRSVKMVIAVILVFVVFAANLFKIQVADADNGSAGITKISTVKAEGARGEIYDRNGKVLVTNRQINAIIFEYSFFPPSSQIEERVEIIDSLINLFKRYGEKWNDSLPIILQNGKAKFKEDSESDVAYLKSKDFLNLNEYATAENCLSALIERYSLQKYSKSRARKIASVCYGMKKSIFSKSNPEYIFSNDVSNELVAVIKENSDFYQGVNVTIKTAREYTDGSIAPHIIGVVGAINAEEYAEKKELGYGMNDNIGKSGIEKSFESYLKGTDGEKAVITDSEAQTQTIYTKDPVQGNAVVLTIDSDLQKTAQQSLDDLVNVKLKGVRNYQIVGSVVVTQIATGDVLASASYPSYDLDTYNEKAAALNKDPLSPLWNRALQSTYTPGSTMKLAVSMAGLEEGVITGINYTAYCKGIYTYYKDYQPKCLGHHGYQNVVNALYNSCNCFFYEVSRLLGISKLNEYCTMFGLGSKTGVELNESAGNLDSVASREALGETWTPGLTLQAGIGHGNNQFTPIQLCSYVSTVASRGTRRSFRFVKSVMSADFSKTVYSSPTEVLSKANFSDSNWDLVEKGMRMVGNHYLSDAVVDVAAKTGTSTVNKRINGRNVESNNGILVCYAPADKPEIAISIVIEGASGGASTAPLAVDIINKYFSESGKTDTVQDYNTLL